MAANPSSGLFDPGMYLEPPQLDTAGMLLLGRSLIHLAPPAPPVSLLAPLQRLKQAWEDLSTASKAGPIGPWRAEGAGKHSVDAPAPLDNAWTALHDRLRAFSMLPESEVPRARRAHDMLRLLFPDALAFLKLPYEQGWAESGNRLRMIERLKLQDELSALAGPEFLTEVRRAHDLYGKMLGIGGEVSTSLPASESTQVRELRASLGRAISHYALKVLSISDEDPSQVRKLLAPLAEHHRTTVDRRPNYGRVSMESQSNPSAERVAAIGRIKDSGTFRAPADPGVLRPILDLSAAPQRDSGIFRVKKPAE